MLNLLIFIVILSILVIVHEFGHFLAARRSGVRVEKFAIGFGPPIFIKKGKETDFLICLFPLGGYVKMAGDSSEECKGLDYEFLSKSPGVKAKIVFAGPLFNYLFAFVLFSSTAFIGLPYSETIVGKVHENYPAYSAGIKEGDRVLAVNNKEVGDWLIMSRAIRASKEKVILKIQRGTEEFVLNVPLKADNTVDRFGRKRTIPVIGIAPSSEVKIIKYGFFNSLFQGAIILFQFTGFIVQGFVFMILGIVPLKEAVTGPIGIYYITSEVVKVGAAAILQFMALLNISLCIVNLLPLPILDGGHIVVFAVERIRRKHLSQKAQNVITRIGVVMLTLLIAFIFYNDIMRFGSRMWQFKEKTQIIIEEK